MTLVSVSAQRINLKTTHRTDWSIGSDSSEVAPRTMGVAVRGKG